MLKYHVRSYVSLLNRFEVGSGSCGIPAGTIIISGLQIKEREVKNKSFVAPW